MKEGIAFPFRTARPESVSALWQFLPAPDAHGLVGSWDVQTPMRVSVQTGLNVREIRQDCDLPPSSALAVSLCWRSRGTSLRGLLETRRIATLVETDEIALSGEIPGGQLATDVEFTLFLHLANGSESATTPLRPTARGSILWSTARRLVLEGEAARFPVESKPFSAAGLPTGAPWILDWIPGDLEAPLLGSVRLLLNSEHPASTEMLSDSSEGRMWRSFMRADVARQMIRGALDIEEFSGAGPSYPEGSVGAHVYELIRLGLPGWGLDALASLAARQPGRFDAEVQGAFLSIDEGAR